MISSNIRTIRNPDLAIYLVHAAFYSVFLVRTVVNRRDHRSGGGAQPPRARDERTASFSRSLIVFHGVGFALMYAGIGAAVFPRRVPEWFAGHRVVGAAVIGLAALLVMWTLVSFRSWRVRAKIEPGHQLATSGPFRLVRHPIYLGVDLMALGTALWIPTRLVWLGVLLVAVGGDLRARAEEALLERAFGERYREYRGRTHRFVPGIY